MAAAVLLRRLRARDRSTGSRAGPSQAGTAAALQRAADAAADALAAPDPELAREREEVATGLRAEAPDPARAGMVEELANGTRLHYCRECGRLASWGFEGAPGRGRAGLWLCSEHRDRGW